MIIMIRIIGITRIIGNINKNNNNKTVIFI